MISAALVLLVLASGPELADGDPCLRRWTAPELPLTLVVLESSEQYLDYIEAAALWWNSQLGTEVFLPPQVIDLTEWRHYRLTPGVVRVETLYEDPTDPRRIAEVEHYPTRAVLRIKADREKVQFPLKTVIHELGHALGLRHHSHARSVMFKTVQDGRVELRRDEYQRLKRCLPSPAR